MRSVALILAFAASLAVHTPMRAQTQSWPATVLITNDDGIDNPGLLALVEAFAPRVKTYVVAPMENKSGSTNYLLALSTRSLEVERRDLMEGVVAYAVDGYPADAVALAIGGLLEEPPDLVVSGINTGPNLGGDWSLSGTVGATRMATVLGVPGIAVSGYSPDHPETLAAAARWVVELAHSSLVKELEPGGYLTVSVPRVPLSEIQGVSVVSRAPRSWTLDFSAAEEGASQPGRQLWRLQFTPHQTTPEQGTDVHAYRANRIAIVPMRVDENDRGLLEQLLRSGAGIPDWPASQGQ